MSDSYAKLFPTLYTGSMYGAGLSVFAVWPWVLAHKDEAGLVEINPAVVSHELGCTAADVKSAIEYLTAPDPSSRTPDEEGRRLMKMSQFGYRVVNHEKYRQQGGSRAAYWREWREKHRKADGIPDDDGDEDAQPPADGATVAQRCAQRRATHTESKSNANANADTPSLIFDQEGFQSLMRGLIGILEPLNDSHINGIKSRLHWAMLQGDDMVQEICNKAATARRRAAEQKRTNYWYRAVKELGYTDRPLRGLMAETLMNLTIKKTENKGAEPCD